MMKRLYLMLVCMLFSPYILVAESYYPLGFPLFFTREFDRRVEKHAHSFMFTRPAYDNIAAKNSGLWHDLLWDKWGKHGSNIQALNIYQQTETQNRMGRYFFFDHSDVLTIRGDTLSPNPNVRMIRAEWLNLPNNFDGILRISYDPDGRLCWAGKYSAAFASPTCTTTEKNGSVISYTYLDDTSAQLSETDADGNTTTYKYPTSTSGDPAYPESPIEIVDPMSKSISYRTYNAAGNVCLIGTTAATTCTATSGDTLSTYDGLGNRVSSTDANGNQTTYSYTNTAFPSLETASTLPTNAQGLHTTENTVYNADGLTCFTGIGTAQPSATCSSPPTGDSNVITTGYDADSRKCWEASGTAPSGATCSSPPTGNGDSTFGYDYLGNQNTMVDNYGTSTPLSSSSSYDADGNMLSGTDDNGKTVTYAYDPGDYLSCIGYPTSGATDNCSLPASGSNTVANYNYNSDAQITGVSDWLGNITSFNYASDGSGNLAETIYPSGTAETAKYTWDPDNNLTKIVYAGSAVAGTDKWTLNNDDLATSTTQVNFSSSPNYDGTHNWTSQNTNNGSVVDKYAYTPTGELSTDTVKSSGALTMYQYSAASQLCWSSSTSSSNACSSPPTGATTYTSTAAGQRCWSAPTAIANASCSSPPSGATLYGWNAYGQLTSSGLSSSTTTYTYDGDGLRSSETAPSGSVEDFVCGLARVFTGTN